MKEVNKDELMIQAFKEQEQKIVEKLKLAESERNIDKQIEYLIELGDIHIQKGNTKLKPYKRSQYTRAMALYYSAFNRAVTEDQKKTVFEKIELAEQSFLKFINIESKITSPDEIDDYKKTLYTLREWCKEELKIIDEKYDITEIEDEKEKQPIENKRAKQVRNIQEKIQETIRDLLAGMIAAAIKQMGDPPCKYTVVGFGSFAECRMTPYSDLEFGILIEEETEENLEYFRNLTELSHLKIIHLGETVLRPMKITSLTDGYFDNSSKNGLKFDSFRYGGCKTPLGSRTEKGDIEFELIHTPKEMAKFQELGNEEFEKQHLPIGLFSSEYILGDKQIFADYQEEVKTVLETGEKKPYLERGRAVLKEDMDNFEIDLISQHEEGKIYDVKREIYRLSDRMIAALCLSLSIYEQNGWEKIEALNSLIGEKNSSHLTVIFSIASEFRLRSYLEMGEQKEEWLPNSIGNLFSKKNPFDIFFRYYYRTFAFQEHVKKFFISFDKKPLRNVYFDKGLYPQAIIHKKLKNYLKSLEFCLGYIEKNSTNPLMLTLTAVLFCTLGDAKKAILYYKKALAINKEMSDEKDSIVATTLHNLGVSYQMLGDLAKAISYYKQALAINKEVYGEKHFSLAITLNNLGLVYEALGKAKRAIAYFEQALAIDKEIYGDKHLAVARAFNNLGIAYETLGEVNKAIDYYEAALAIIKVIYGENHPTVAATLNNLGEAFRVLNDANKAIAYYEQALTIFKGLYGNKHPDVAVTLSNLGLAYLILDDTKKAISYCEQALMINKELYGEKHPNVARDFNHLGFLLHRFKQSVKAFFYALRAYALQLVYFEESHPHTRTFKTTLSITAVVLMNQLILKGERKRAQQYKKFEGTQYKDFNQYYEHAHSNPNKTAILLPIAYAQLLIELAPWESEGYYELAKSLLIAAIDAQTSKKGQWTQRTVQKAFDNIKKAMELKPCSLYQSMYAYFLLNQGQYDDAIQQARQVLTSISQASMTNDLIHFHTVDEGKLLPSFLQSYLSTVNTANYSAKIWALLVLIIGYQTRKDSKSIKLYTKFLVQEVEKYGNLEMQVLLAYVYRITGEKKLAEDLFEKIAKQYQESKNEAAYEFLLPFTKLKIDVKKVGKLFSTLSLSSMQHTTFFSKNTEKTFIKDLSSTFIEKTESEWYTQDEINKLLIYYQNLTENENADILTCLLGTDINKNNNMLRDNLVEYQKKRMENIVNNKPVKDHAIIPLNLGNAHWVLLYITYPTDNAKLPSIQYIDPLGEDIHDEVKEALHDELLYPDAEIDVSPHVFQKDSYNCGVWVVEIARHLMEEKTLNETIDIDIDVTREEHQKIIQGNNRMIKFL